MNSLKLRDLNSSASVIVTLCDYLPSLGDDALNILCYSSPRLKLLVVAPQCLNPAIVQESEGKQRCMTMVVIFSEMKFEQRLIDVVDEWTFSLNLASGRAGFQ